jgi:hypothetical protein
VLTEVVGNLLIDISDKANKNLLREKLGSPPVDMEIDAVLIIRVVIFEIVGKSGNGREFVPDAGLK